MPTFNVTPAQFSQIQQKAGIPSTEMNGTVTQSGVTAGWSYSPSLEQLTATILKKPRLIPEGLVWSRFRSWAGL
jgi:hypothetical protein